MATFFEKYIERLNSIKLMKQQEIIQQDEMQQSSMLPEDEIQLRSEVITPHKVPDNELLSRDIRTANLNTMDYLIMKKVFLFESWLKSFIKNKKLTDDDNMFDLMKEVKEDGLAILNLSVSRKGWLIDNILNPKRRFSLTSERAEKQHFWQRGEKAA